MCSGPACVGLKSVVTYDLCGFMCVKTNSTLDTEQLCVGLSMSELKAGTGLMHASAFSFVFVARFVDGRSMVLRPPPMYV